MGRSVFRRWFDVKRFISDTRFVPLCSGNVELVNRLLLDAGITHGLSQVWKERALQ